MRIQTTIEYAPEEPGIILEGFFMAFVNLAPKVLKLVEIANATSLEEACAKMAAAEEAESTKYNSTNPFFDTDWHVGDVVNAHRSYNSDDGFVPVPPCAGDHNGDDPF